MYRYFISFKNSMSFTGNVYDGNSQIEYPSLIENINDIQNIEEHLCKALPAQTVVINNYILMGKVPE